MDTALEQATHQLADALRASEPVIALREAESTLHAQPTSIALLDQTQRIQRRLQAAQTRGDTPPPGVLEQLQQAHEAATADATIMAFAQAQQEAQAQMAELNDDLSEALGLDFASLTGRSGC